MSQVVFTSITKLSDLETATWHAGDNNSYANTKKMFLGEFDAWDCIRLIGRQDKYGRVQLCYAATSNQDWTVVSNGTLRLARYFMSKFDECLVGDTLRDVLQEIDDVAVANDAQSLIAAECGINVTKEPWGKLHTAVLHVQCGLRALGVPCGDWTFVPMFNSFEAESKK